MNIEQDSKIKIKKQIRTKRVCSHPNPLFEEWLKEWKTEAEKRGSNMKYNFQKAIKSLQKFPLPLHSGKDCLVLANFGNKICNLIDKKIEEYIEEHGPINWEDHINVKDKRVVGKNSKGKRESVSKASIKNKKNLNTSKKDFETNNETRNERKRYIPAYRSGAYALLIAMYKAANSSNYSGFLRKQELIEASQSMCDSSFTIAPEGSYYTAWSSMSSLIKKNFVEQQGSPCRYILTKEGESLATLLMPSNSFPTPSSSSGEEKRLSQKVESRCTGVHSLCNKISIHEISSSDESQSDEECRLNKKKIEIFLIEDDDDSANEEDGLQTPSEERSHETVRAVPVVESTANDDDSANEDGLQAPSEERSHETMRAVPVVESTANDLSFTYVTPESLETPLKEKSCVTVDEENGTLLFLIKAKLIDLLSSDLDYQLEDTRVAPPGYTYAFLSDSCAPEFSAGLNRLGKPREKSTEKIETISDGFYSSDEEATSSLGERLNRLKPTCNAPNQLRKSSPKKEAEITLQERKRKKRKSEEASHSSTSDKNSSTSDENTCSNTLKASKLCAEDAILFTLKPRTYKVVLSMDNSEVFGGKSTKEIIKNELEKNGVDVQVRNLNVGDFLWTCRGLDSNGEEAEVVLPFVIERKRMDDLSRSIRDGRFKEQKFRLKQSGLSQPIYLVEEFGSSYSTMPLATCEQAVTNTQIIDNFYVKFTKDQKETAAYLTIMTRYLQGTFKDKTLHCVARDSPSLSKSDWSSSVLFFMSFKEMNSFSAKNHPLRLQEMFAKHLLQIHGASVDKVSSIILKYKTPRALIEALEAKPSSARENFLRDLKCQKSGRAIDQTVSAQIARLYTWETLL